MREGGKRGKGGREGQFERGKDTVKEKNERTIAIVRNRRGERRNEKETEKQKGREKK